MEVIYLCRFRFASDLEETKWVDSVTGGNGFVSKHVIFLGVGFNTICQNFSKLFQTISLSNMITKVILLQLLSMFSI